MIRINLLPVRAAKRKESVRFQLTVAGLVTFLALAASMAVYFTAGSEARALQAEISSGNEELASLKQKIGELSRIKEQKRVVEEKLKIIESLEAAKTGPTKLFRMINETIPERAWIRSMKDGDGIITLNGYAENEEVVAEFMRRLQKHRGQGEVELEVAQSVRDPETKAEVVSFIIRLGK